MATYYGAGNKSAKLVELRKKRDEHRLFSLGIFFVTILIGCAAIVTTIRLPWFQIKKISISGTQVVSREAVQAAISEELSGKTLLVIPKNSILVYPRKKILAMLSEKFPRLTETTLTPDGLQGLQLTTHERSGVYLWCGATFSLEAPCYFTDDRGYLFAAAPSFSGTIYLKFFGGENSGAENPLGSHVLSEASFASIVDMAVGLEKIGLTPHAVVILDETNEFLVSSPVTVNRGRIIIPKDGDTDVLLSSIKAAAGVDPLKTKLAKNNEGLEYIDLRFSKKVYYKFSEEEAKNSE
jgi:hypothetical protein